jgi:dipeptidyl aminopeptidase/acylaminoacyl peptidase
MKFLLTLSLLLIVLTVVAQKIPLDHSVYDKWQSITDRKISNNGNWIAYTIDPQEGDGSLVIQSTKDANNKIIIPRGYGASISSDNQHVLFLIKPYFNSIRAAKIKKLKPEDFPKDSLGMLTLNTMSLSTMENVKSFQFPKDASGIVAIHLQKKLDSIKKNNSETADAGSNLIIKSLNSNKSIILKNISEFKWSKNGKILLAEGRYSPTLSSSQNCMLIYRTVENKVDTISKGGNEFMHFDIDENAYQVAFIAERDSSVASLRKFYKLWYWRNGMDSAILLADKNTVGMHIGWSISPNAPINFSKSGKNLYFGNAPIKAPKDTSLVDFEVVKLDIWHYNDDYLQPQQLKNVDIANKKSFLAAIEVDQKKLVQIATDSIPDVYRTIDGDGEYMLGITDIGHRIASQWTGNTPKSLYSIQVSTGKKQLIKQNVNGYARLSPTGKYVFWYDEKLKQYFTWSNGKLTNISLSVPVKLYDETFDMPDDPNAYGVAGWTTEDAALLVYDRFDIWKLDPLGKSKPINITSGIGRKSHTNYRYTALDPEEKNIKTEEPILLKSFNEINQKAGLVYLSMFNNNTLTNLMEGDFALGLLAKAKNATQLVYTKETYKASPDVYVWNANLEVKLSAINPFQDNYTWGDVELIQYKAYDGKQATGMVFKPENFNPAKKYPLICYFYEKLSDTRYTYRAPAPTRSRLDISFFVSRGYMVFVPDIQYTIGYPGKSAYDYVVSGARALVKKGWVDSTKMGLQGQSWGGYQIAYIVTKTKLFAAAWAGAPVANMTSAYGGIRWESGVNRQFQYEHTQSRIGATLWENPKLYIDNSPLFSVPKITTPLVIMSNDDDGAVPWYQGIELFTAMRRVGKKVWLLNYNGEKHNLEERRNKKDLSIREQQFFDWLLKGERPTRWITDGVPATEKGKDWGLD